MPERPEFVPGVRLAARDLALEQQCRWQRGRMHNRLLHGWGVCCGLQVVPANDPQRPWAVRVCPGYALSPCGDEIEVRCSVVVDIAEWLWALKTPAAPQPAAAVIAIRFVTREERLVPSPSEACRCGPPQAEASRLADDFRIDVLPDSAPASPPPVDLCTGQPVACAASPGSTSLPLARVVLPASAGLILGAGSLTGIASLLTGR